jgi:hypothetical protein
MTVDNIRQMAVEYKNIDNKYMENNARRDYKLTS